MTKNATMKNRGLLLLTSAIILLPMLAGLLLWARLPQTMATHFGPDGTPNGFMNRALVVFMIPLALLALHWLCIFSGKYMPNIGGKTFAVLVLWIIPATSIFMGLITYGYALNASMDITRMGITFLGVIFMAIGNYMPKVTRNFVVGIKIPTTLADEDNWNRTHRFAGPIWVAGGLTLLLCGMLGISSWGLPLVILIVLALLPVGYSMMLAAKKGSSQE